MIFGVMLLSLVGAAGRADPAGSCFELGFVGGVVRRVALTACAAVRFEDAAPVRGFRWSRRLPVVPEAWAFSGLVVGGDDWPSRWL
jgi:hypothetical protein